MAAKEGLIFALGLGLRAIVLEGDAKLIIDSFEKSTVDRSHDETILAKAYDLAFRFNFFKANFVPRICNSIANRLVGLANIWDNQIETDEAPNCILDILALEARA